MRVFRRNLVAVTILWFACAAAGACKDLALISNKANGVKDMSMVDLAKVCKGQTPRWPDGKPVTFIARDPGSPAMKIVLEKVYGMSKDEVNAAIAAANHGRTNHPAIVIVDSDESLVNKVEGTVGAVGLVDVYSITGGVTVLKVAGKLPLEAGYPLHGN